MNLRVVFWGQVEEEREARVRQERMARDAFKAKDADMTALEACLAEARERESALLQEKIQAEARAERAAREVRRLETPENTLLIDPTSPR